MPRDPHWYMPVPNLMIKVRHETLEALLRVAEKDASDVCTVARRILEDATRTAESAEPQKGVEAAEA